MKMRLRKKQGLTTEEASGVLGVAINTVIKYFDKGILTGWKNPVTRRIVIDLESVKALVALNRKRSITIRKAIDDFSGRGHKKG